MAKRPHKFRQPDKCSARREVLSIWCVKRVNRLSLSAPSSCARKSVLEAFSVVDLPHQCGRIERAPGFLSSHEQFPDVKLQRNAVRQPREKPRRRRRLRQNRRPPRSRRNHPHGSEGRRQLPLHGPPYPPAHRRCSARAFGLPSGHVQRVPRQPALARVLRQGLASAMRRPQMRPQR